MAPGTRLAAAACGFATRYPTVAMSPREELPDERWQFRFNVLGLLIVAVLAGAFFFLYGNDLVNFLLRLVSPSLPWQTR